MKKACVKCGKISSWHFPKGATPLFDVCPFCGAFMHFLK